MPTMHTLAELIHRLMEGKEYLDQKDQKDGTDSDGNLPDALEMFTYPISKLYEFLDEEDFKTAYA